MTNETIIEDLRLVAVPAWWQSPWVWLLFAILAGGAIFLIRKWRHSRPIPLKMPSPAPAGPPAHLAALRRLEELRARHAQIGAYEVALECSDILRRYIEERFGSPIRYQTTREFLGAAQSIAELSADSRVELGRFLEFFDGIKFAQEGAASEQTGAAIDGAERFVRKCIPVDVVTAA